VQTWPWVGLTHGLGWVEGMMDWVGLGYENWTHGHVWVSGQRLRGISALRTKKKLFELFKWCGSIRYN